MSGGSPQDYYCPLCKGAERVEKVSVLFEASAATANYGIDGSMRVLLKTAAHSKFAPPSEPMYQEPTYQEPRYPMGPFRILGVILVSILFFGSIFGSISGLIHPGDSWISFDGRKLLYIPPSVFFAGAILSTLLLIIIYIIASPIVKKAKKEQEEAFAKAKKERKEAFAIEHQRWVRAMEAWRKLYCCTLHDIVFLPGETRRYVSASYMRELLYS